MTVIESSPAPPGIDAYEVLREIGSLVREHGQDHRAGGKYYDDAGEPVCIVGHVVRRLTPEIKLVEYARIMAQTAALSEVGYTKRAVAILSRAQQAQDGDPGTWGLAYEAAKTANWAINDFIDLSGPE